VTTPRSSLAKRAGAAIAAAALGLVVGSAATAVVSTVVLLFSSGLEVASPRAYIAGSLALLAEGMFWALLGGGMFVFPIAVLVLVFVAPRHTNFAAVGLSLVLLLPIAVVTGPGRGVMTFFLLAVPVWIGVRAGLSLHSKMMGT
jgi:hypothetical protein